MRKQLSDLKRTPPNNAMQTQGLIESMDRLHEALTRMVVILENANRAMAQDALQGMRDEHAKLDKLLDQNEKLARAVVSLADMIKEPRARPIITSAPVAPVQQPMQAAPVMTSAIPFTPLPQPVPGHDEMSFLAQPAVNQRPAYAALQQMQQATPTVPLPPQAPSQAITPQGSLPPLPPMPTLPPALGAGTQDTPAKRPILRSFA